MRATRREVELWEEGASFPVSATRGIRGMEVSGPMQAALSQENQLLGSGELRTALAKKCGHIFKRRG